MKNIKTFSALAAMTAMLFTTSCNDELNDEFNKMDTNQVVGERLCGYTNLIVPADEIESERVDLSSNNLRISNSNSLLSYTIEQDEEGYHLLTHVNGGTNLRHYDNVTITAADGSKKEELHVCIDPVKKVSRGTVSPEVNEKQSKALGIIGYGVDYFGSIGACKGSPIIDVNRFLDDDYRTQLRKALNINNSISKTTHYFTKANSLTEISETTEKKMGMKVKFPIKFLNISAGFEKTHFENVSTTERREYLMAGVNVIGFEASLDLDELPYVAQEISGEPYSGDDKLPCILSRSFNNALNNPGTSTGQKYPSDKAGMIKLLDTYGTHVVTQAQFGAYAQLSFSMKENTTSTRTENFMARELGITSNETTDSKTTTTTEKKGESGDVAKTVFNKVVVPATPSFSYNDSQKEGNSNSHQDMEAKYNCITAGGLNIGSSNDLSGWSCNSISEMVPLTYGTANTLESVDQGLDNTSLVPIYEFCTDPTRKAILKELLTPDENGVLPYYTERLKNTEEAKIAAGQEMVIADVQLVYVGTKDLTNALIQPRQLKDHFGVTRTYYPMVMNDSHPEKSVQVRNDVGRALTLNHYYCTDIDFNGSWNTGRMLCYYALDYANKTNGITNIRLMTERQYKDGGARNEFRANTVSTKEGDGKNIEVISGCGTWQFGRSGIWVYDEGKQYLYVTYGTAQTPDSEKIKGVAWHIGDAKKPYEGYTIGATGGTEYDINKKFGKNDKADFDYYWRTKGNVQCNSNLDGSHFTSLSKSCELTSIKKRRILPDKVTKETLWFDTHPDGCLHPVFTKLSIKRDMSPVTSMVNGKPVGGLPISMPIPY